MTIVMNDCLLSYLLQFQAIPTIPSWSLLRIASDNILFFKRWNVDVFVLALHDFKIINTNVDQVVSRQEVWGRGLALCERCDSIVRYPMR